jgi:hypothetical protein
MIAAEPDTMALFIDSVRSDYGTFENYAARIGVDSAPRYLRAALLS